MLVVIIFFLAISLVIVIGMTGPGVREYRVAQSLLTSKKSYALAESAGEDMFYRIKNAKRYASSETLTLDGSTATTTVTSLGATRKEILSKGSISGTERSVRLKISTGDGVSFNYGIQSGSGGFIMDNGSQVIGNVYSSGTIQGYNNSKSKITGSAVSAGVNGKIDKVWVGTAGIGDANAHVVTSSVIEGNLYCFGGLANNKSCNTSKPDPVDIGMPISDQQIADWKATAEAGGVITGNVSPTGGILTIGPKKITGNLVLNKDDKLVLTGVLWVQGSITTNNKADISLASSYGSDDGILIADKQVNLSNATTFAGSGSSESYILLATTSDCPTSVYCDGDPAINIQNNAGAVILNAQNGTLNVQNGSNLKSAAAKLIRMINNATITYDTGIADSNFVTGPSGTWETTDWKEVE